MFIKISEQPNIIKSRSNPIYLQKQTIQANHKMLSTHKLCLCEIKKASKQNCKKSISPFSLFNQKIPLANPYNISLIQPTVLIEKISHLGKPKSMINPLGDFIKSLSSAAKPTASKPSASSQFSSEIVGIVEENKEFKTLRLKRPKDWNFIPGQYLEIRGENSSATKPAILAIASSVNDDYIEITAKPNQNPSHANYCLNGSIGEHLTITGPLGSNFPLNLISDSTPVLVLGGGSGLTALKSVMESLPFGTDSKLIYSSKTTQELIYPEEIEKWKSLGHTITLTQDQAAGFEQGRITEHLKNSVIKPNTLVFICGPKELVLETAKLLSELGIPRESIFGSLPATAKDGGPVYRGDHPKMISENLLVV